MSLLNAQIHFLMTRHSVSFIKESSRGEKSRFTGHITSDACTHIQTMNTVGYMNMVVAEVERIYFEQFRIHAWDSENGTVVA